MALRPRGPLRSPFARTMDGEPKWRVGRERKTSYEEDKEATLVHQRRMEGQVRGLRQMVRDDRFHLEVVRQINAILALGLAWFATTRAERPADASKTHGYHRTGILAAFANAATLIVMVLARSTALPCAGG